MIMSTAILKLNGCSNLASCTSDARPEDRNPRGWFTNFSYVLPRLSTSCTHTTVELMKELVPLSHRDDIRNDACLRASLRETRAGIVPMDRFLRDPLAALRNGGMALQRRFTKRHQVYTHYKSFFKKYFSY